MLSSLCLFSKAQVPQPSLLLPVCAYGQDANLGSPFSGLTAVLPVAPEMERSTIELEELQMGRWPEKGTCEEGSEGGQFCLSFSYILLSPALLDPWR